MTPKQEAALRQALETFERMGHKDSIFAGEFNGEITALREALANEALDRMAENARELGLDYEVPTLLPDGSAFGVMSFPLPSDHWLYAPNEYRDGEDEPIDLPKPILTHAMRDAVVAAVRYAIRGATMRGQENDFDPDALVQNAVYALCGPYGTAIEQQPAAPLTGLDVYLDPNDDLKPKRYPKPAAQFAGSYGTIDESAAKRIATALGWKPKRTWVGLTQQDIDIAFDDTQEGGGFNEFARAIEAKLREKNAPQQSKEDA